MPTLILSPRYTDDSQSLWRVAVARGWDVQRLKTWHVSDDIRSSEDPFLYVEALFGPTLADELGVRLVDPPEDWLCRLPNEYSKRTIRLSTLEEARKLTEPAFVKPPNDKSFLAAVYAPNELPAAFDAQMSVLISEPVNFASEFRCFVLERQLRTFSLYARNSEPSPAGPWSELEADALRAFTSELLADERVELPRACVLDCGPIDARGWGVVELNAAWGAGIYACDPDLVIDVVRAATEGVG